MIQDRVKKFLTFVKEARASDNNRKDYKNKKEFSETIKKFAKEHDGVISEINAKYKEEFKITHRGNWFYDIWFSSDRIKHVNHPNDKKYIFIGGYNIENNSYFLFEDDKLSGYEVSGYGGDGDTISIEDDLSLNSFEAFVALWYQIYDKI